MKKLGLKKSLIISVMVLVSLSASLLCGVLYFQEKKALTESILKESETYITSQAKSIGDRIQGKIAGLDNIAEQFRQTPITGSDSERLQKVKMLAHAADNQSAVFAFDNGEAFWTLGTQLAPETWPGNKLNGDGRSLNWYAMAQQQSGVVVTEPYIYPVTNTYWITLAKRIANGAVALNIQLDFMDGLVRKTASDSEGTIAFILNSDSTVIASSDSRIPSGQPAFKMRELQRIAKQAIGVQSSQSDAPYFQSDKMFFSHQISIGDKHWYYVIGLDHDRVFSKLFTARNTAIILSMIAVLISALVSYGLIQNLYTPILALKATIGELCKGEADLTQRLEVTSGDDLGQIAASVNQFIDNLHHMMCEIQDAVTTLESSVENMNQQSARNSNILQEHVSQTEQVVASIEEMSATARSMAEDAANTAGLTRQAAKAGTDSGEAVRSSQATVNSLVQDADRSAADVEMMVGETQKITQILTEIGGIAEQTNLLALNAAIEAARAGEQGRGFAVVADEVRGLAARTKQSTTEVEEALTGMMQGTEAVVGSMDRTKSRCRETSHASEVLFGRLGIINTHVEDINALSMQIATAAEEQSQVTSELSENMAMINRIVLELGDNGRQAVADADEIRQINQQLTVIVNRFKL
ncbi:Methyl-accepting chemotaxis protein PctC [Vibrio aerogenes CECT 7868]|uniref:Methyl-accepting chemotaxis protein PctC n=1 Tax=Vibrio aerogenes CECT 7868 TaxID=1216006 RepID=A0A1M5ZTE5_9VIBR|nr:methyl-accepting chemotaxis protein [Vibrio aerogenes]SHI27448.1 Methyl-accepting chemotaxis protein PctC [Vibrio aerogenes CECT 7868]